MIRIADARMRGYMAVLFLSGAFLLCIIFAALLSPACKFAFADEGNSLLAMSAVNTLVMFGLPGFLVCWWMKMTPADYMGIRRPEGPYPVIWFGRGLILFMFSVAFINQTIYWNEIIPFPDEGIWKTMLEMEESAAKTTQIMLGSTSVGGLIAGILIVGVLTGICEELFFRGAMQKTFMMCGAGPHAAIWITAAVFSLLHFQILGFIPRLILGAIFGYMMFYSGSVWVSAMVHAINNSYVVLSTWLVNTGVWIDATLNDFGTRADGFPSVAVASAVLTVVILSNWQKHRSYLSARETPSDNQTIADESSVK